MKKGFISFAVLTIALIVCSNAGECKTVNNYYTVQPPQIAQNNSILYGKQNVPFYTVNHNNNFVSNNKHKKPPKHKKNNKIAQNNYGYNYNPYGYNYNPYGYNYNYNSNLNNTSIWQRIFNL